MSMLHSTAAGVDIKYKSNRTIPLLTHLANRWWSRKVTREAAEEALNEVLVLRQRMADAAVEISEWRMKVGGAAYAEKGPVFMAMVEEGIKNRIGPYIRLTDEDFYPGM